MGTIEPVELVDEDEAFDLVISGASCIIIAMSRFSLFGVEAAKEGIEVALLGIEEESVDVDVVEVEVDALEVDAEETVVNSAGRWRACTSVMRRACLA